MFVECDGPRINKRVKTGNCSALVLNVCGGYSVLDSTALNRYVLEHFPRFSRRLVLYSDL